MNTLPATKERIQRTALRLFVEKGVPGTTTRDIAAGAGIAEGTIYRHYSGKDDLVWDLFSTNYAAFARTLDDLQRRHGALRAKLDAMVRAFCRLFDEDRALFSFLLLVQHQQLEKVPDTMATPVAVLRTVLAEGMDRGEAPARDPDLATAMVMGIVLQTATFAVYGRLGRPLSEVADDLSAACWRVVGN